MDDTELLDVCLDGVGVTSLWIPSPSAHTLLSLVASSMLRFDELLLDPMDGLTIRLVLSMVFFNLLEILRFKDIA